MRTNTDLWNDGRRKRPIVQSFPVEAVEPLVFLDRLKSVDAVADSIGRILSVPAHTDSAQSHSLHPVISLSGIDAYSTITIPICVV